MKPKYILTVLTAAIAAFVQPVLAEFTQNKNGEITHVNGIPLPPMQTVEEARAQAQKEIVAANKAGKAARAENNQPINRKASSATPLQEIFYTGKPYIEEIGQYAFLFRSYDPELSRWTTADPSGFPDGANNWQYVANNPVEKFDWAGLTGKSVLWITMPDMYGNGNFNGSYNYMGIFNDKYFSTQSDMQNWDQQSSETHYLDDGDLFYKYVPSSMQAMLNEMNGYTKVFLHTHGGYDPDTGYYWFIGPDKNPYDLSVFSSLGNKITIVMGTCFNGYAFGSNVTSLNNNYNETYFFNTYNDFRNQTIAYLRE